MENALPKATKLSLHIYPLIRNQLQGSQQINSLSVFLGSPNKEA
jgi:hypothetical protein